MKNRKNSNILIVSSYAAYDPESTIGFYSVTKTALVSMSKLIAKELAEYSIRCNCIAPGLIKT
jgi:dehydrogenase/reductase SDR family protein 4